MGNEVGYNPDILSCLANLSNDEVFTPPELANAVLDMIPEEFWSDPNVKVLDPCTKSGVFLREAAKRFIKGLEKKIPDLQERVDHISHKQLYGIAITELTGYIARRSLYCSKSANGDYSVSRFKSESGNIIYNNVHHTWDGDNCKYCGAPRSEYDRASGLEQHAYEFIHLDDKELKELQKVHFDLIIGNPPYQMSDGGARASAKPIYHLFVQQAKKLKPRYLTMIIPSRWFAGGKGLDEFRNEMLHDRSLISITDYFDSNECFPSVDIAGGICYFLWSRDDHGDCKVISHRGETVSEMTRPLMERNSESFVRFNEAIPILRKIEAFKEESFANTISSRKPFGLETSIALHKTCSNDNFVKCFAYPENGYIARDCILNNSAWVDKYKVCISYAYGERGSFPYCVIGKPFIADKGTCCTETYLVVNTVESEEEARNIISYMITRFFRFLVLLKKNTQHATKTVYEFVPTQDFSKAWTDEELYRKYNLTDKEIEFIDSMIRPMEL